MANQPPVLILGGSSNALSIARNLSRRGIDVYLSVQYNSCAAYTRYPKKLFVFKDKKQVSDYWHELLIGKPNTSLTGSMIFPCSDDGIEFVARHHAVLQERYVLGDAIPDVHLIMLNKRSTMEKARDAGIPTPTFAVVESPEDIQKIDPNTLQFPVIVKPQHSHHFQKAFNGEKLFFASDAMELQQRLDQVLQKQLKVIVSEMIPGPDTLLGSYYTYLDNNDTPLFHYTKAVVRRYPKNNGQGCYHITRWNPEVAELGLNFFRRMGLKGLGNVEFKKDLRDGQWKLIECNPRFTAAHELLVRCGMPIDWLIYCHLSGRPVPQLDSFTENMTLWYPYRDWRAANELKSLGELTTYGWLRSITKNQVLPHFSWSDPLPTIKPFMDSLKYKFSKTIARANNTTKYPAANVTP